MEYFEPKTIGDALSVLAKHGAHAKVIAGGTDVMVDVKFKEEPEALVNIKKLTGLNGIFIDPGEAQVTVLAHYTRLDEEQENAHFLIAQAFNRHLSLPVSSRWSCPRQRQSTILDICVFRRGSITWRFANGMKG